MVFVPVRENQGADFVAVLLQISEVGRDNVDAEQFRIRKHHARVDNDNVVPIADGHRIHTEFAQAAQRDQLKLVFRHVRFRLSVGLWVVAGCWWLVAGGWWLVAGGRMWGGFVFAWWRDCFFAKRSQLTANGGGRCTK